MLNLFHFNDKMFLYSQRSIEMKLSRLNADLEYFSTNFKTICGKKKCEKPRKNLILII